MGGDFNFAVLLQRSTIVARQCDACRRHRQLQRAVRKNPVSRYGFTMRNGVSRLEIAYGKKGRI